MTAMVVAPRSLVEVALEPGAGPSRPAGAASGAGTTTGSTGAALSPIRVRRRASAFPTRSIVARRTARRSSRWPMASWSFGPSGPRPSTRRSVTSRIVQGRAPTLDAVGFATTVASGALASARSGNRQRGDRVSRERGRSRAARWRGDGRLRRRLGNQRALSRCWRRQSASARPVHATSTDAETLYRALLLPGCRGDIDSPQLNCSHMAPRSLRSARV
jgi:hypothetical protein